MDMTLFDNHYLLSGFLWTPIPKLRRKNKKKTTIVVRTNGIDQKKLIEGRTWSAVEGNVRQAICIYLFIYPMRCNGGVDAR